MASRSVPECISLLDDEDTLDSSLDCHTSAPHHEAPSATPLLATPSLPRGASTSSPARTARVSTHSLPGGQFQSGFNSLVMNSPAPRDAANQGDGVSQVDPSDVNTYLEDCIMRNCQHEGVTVWRAHDKPRLDQIQVAETGWNSVKFTKVSLRAQPVPNGPSVTTDRWLATIWEQDGVWYLFVAWRVAQCNPWDRAQIRVFTPGTTIISNIVNNLTTMFMYRIAQATLDSKGDGSAMPPNSARGIKRRRTDIDIPATMNTGELKREEVELVGDDDESNLVTIDLLPIHSKKTTGSDSGLVVCEMLRQLLKDPEVFWDRNGHGTSGTDGYPDATATRTTFNLFFAMRARVKAAEAQLQARHDEACRLLLEDLEMVYRIGPEHGEAVHGNYQEIMASRKRKKSEEDIERKRKWKLDDIVERVGSATAWLEDLPDKE